METVCTRKKKEKSQRQPDLQKEFSTKHWAERASGNLLQQVKFLVMIYELRF